MATTPPAAALLAICTLPLPAVIPKAEPIATAVLPFARMATVVDLAEVPAAVKAVTVTLTLVSVAFWISTNAS